MATNGNGTGHLPSRKVGGDLGLDDLLAKYELVGVNQEGYVLATRPDGTSESYKLNIPALEEHQTTVSPGQATGAGEIQVGGETLYRRSRLTDYRADLSGQLAIDQYREMKNDAVVRTTLKMAKTPVISARWFVEPASNEQIDLDVADFIDKNLNLWLNVSFHEFLIQVLTMLDYGVAAFEKVFDTIDWTPPSGATPETKIYWRKFAPRAVDSIQEFVYDDFGGPESIRIGTETGEEDLKALIFTYDKEAGDLWGRSVLRSAYKHWFYKEQLYKIDAIQKERHGIGIPIIVLPPNGFKKGVDDIEAQRIGMMLRTNERSTRCPAPRLGSELPEAGGTEGRRTRVCTAPL
jgi:hypothetical protein